MDKMEEWEIRPICSGLQYTDRNSWEQTRLRIYSLACMFSKQQRDVSDIMKFPWEKEEIEKNTEISNNDIKRLKERAAEMARSMSGETP